MKVQLSCYHLCSTPTSLQSFERALVCFEKTARIFSILFYIHAIICVDTAYELKVLSDRRVNFIILNRQKESVIFYDNAPSYDKLSTKRTPLLGVREKIKVLFAVLFAVFLPSNTSQKSFEGCLIQRIPTLL